MDNLSETAQKKEEVFCKESKTFVQRYVTESLDYSYAPEDLAELDDEIAKHNEEINKFAVQEKDYTEAKNSMWSHLKANSQGLLKGISKNLFA